MKSLKNEKIVFQIFTAVPIIKLHKGNKHLTWTIDDNSKAIGISSAGAKAYNLSLKKGYRFLAIPTLKTWCKKHLNTQILTQVLPTLSKQNLKSCKKYVFSHLTNLFVKQSDLRVKGRKSLLPFQTSTIITNKSLKLLYEDVKAKYVNYILTISS